MGNTKETKKKLISTVEVIKKINDDPKKFASDSISDAYTNNFEDIVGKKKDYLNKKINQKKEITNPLILHLITISQHPHRLPHPHQPNRHMQTLPKIPIHPHIHILTIMLPHQTHVICIRGKHF